MAQGIGRAAQELAPFNVSVDFLHYTHAGEASYSQGARRCSARSATPCCWRPISAKRPCSSRLPWSRKGTPYAFIDFNVEGTNALCYIGQDSRISGYIAAKMLMGHYREGQELVFFLNNRKQNPAEIQMQRRMEELHANTWKEKHVGLPVHDVVLDKENAEANRHTLDRFFRECPRAVLGVVFNSRVYQVADYLHATGRRMEGLVGYDLLQKNVERLKTGEVDYLIGNGLPCRAMAASRPCAATSLSSGPSTPYSTCPSTC